MCFVDVWGKTRKGFSINSIGGIFAREQDVPYGWIQKFFPLDFCKNVLNFYMGHSVVVHLDIL